MLSSRRAGSVTGDTGKQINHSRRVSVTARKGIEWKQTDFYGKTEQLSLLGEPQKAAQPGGVTPGGTQELSRDI